MAGKLPAAGNGTRRKLPKMSGIPTAIAEDE